MLIATVKGELSMKIGDGEPIKLGTVDIPIEAEGLAADGGLSLRATPNMREVREFVDQVQPRHRVRCRGSDGPGEPGGGEGARACVGAGRGRRGGVVVGVPAGQAGRARREDEGGCVMQTFVVEARRNEDGPWMPVTSVQEDLVDDVVGMVAAEPWPGDVRIRTVGEAQERPAAAQKETVKITVWDRIRWWALFRFSRKARR